MDWNDITKKKPPENKDVLVYTDGGKMRVASYHGGMWNTYLKICAWTYLPKDKPDFLETQESIVKRGRKKKVKQ